jgi:UDP-4-amino-4,6-dideoxy-N-acetyl-beta-L-altrosamine transaminase
MIPYGRQSISRSDIDAVSEVLGSDWLTQGPMVPRFEADVAGYVDAPFAVAVSSGTAALHVACLAAGLGSGGLLWTSPITFVASANCGRYVGADVDFVDIDPATLCMSAGALEHKLIEADRAGKLPDVVVPVDMAGQSCDMTAVRALADRYGFLVIEDASHAIGATFEGSKVGSCRFADMTVLSFHPVKIVTTGEGGMITARDSRHAERSALLRTHGITRDASLMEREPDGPWYYEQIDLGFNYRMTDIQAALGVSQMTRIEEFLARRRELAARYDEALSDLVATPSVDPRGASAWHLYVIRVEADRRREIFDSLRGTGIGVNVHYIPVHLQPYYRRLGFEPGDFPDAERYYGGAISLPLYAGLSDSDQDKVLAAVRSAVS